MFPDKKCGINVNKILFYLQYNHLTIENNIKQSYIIIPQIHMRVHVCRSVKLPTHIDRDDDPLHHGP